MVYERMGSSSESLATICQFDDGYQNEEQFFLDKISSFGLLPSCCHVVMLSCNATAKVSGFF